MKGLLTQTALVILLKLTIVILVIANIYVIANNAYKRGWEAGLQEGISGSCKGTWAKNIPWNEQVGCREGDK